MKKEKKNISTSKFHRFLRLFEKEKFSPLKKFQIEKF